MTVASVLPERYITLGRDPVEVGAQLEGGVRGTDLRVGDAERGLVVERLARAQAQGRLDLYEYDERLRDAWAARTVGELDRVTADLPTELVETAATQRRPASPGLVGCAPGPARVAVASWVFASSVNVLIWAIVSLASTSWVYPWWIWVAGPWGVVLLVEWTGSRMRDGLRGSAVR